MFNYHQMKKGLSILIILFLIGCGTKRSVTESKPLFEILTAQEDGGASIRFFEILTEEKEIKMLISFLRVKKEDVIYLIDNHPDFIKEELTWIKKLEKGN